MSKQREVLTKEAKADLMRALRLLSDAVEILQRWKMCGEDCTHYEAIAENLRRQLEAYRSQFG